MTMLTDFSDSQDLFCKFDRFLFHKIKHANFAKKFVKEKKIDWH